jgi:predicted porin
MEFVMKKSLIALAVLAASGASFAQSSVTLYGIADAWFGSVKASQKDADGNIIPGTMRRNTVVESGGVASSRFGFKGSEDLGGGLKANFLLEQGFNIDTGTAGTTTDQKAGTSQAFSRQAYVGLSGGFGEVKLGKMWTAYDDIAGDFKTTLNSDALSPIAVWGSQGYAANPNNGIYYGSPTMGGFSGAVSYALGEDKTVGVDASSTAAFNVKYAGGPVTVALAHQIQEPTGNLESTKFTTLRGSYDFGVAKLTAGAGRVSLGAERATDWLVGVDFPVSSALTLSAGYARSKDNDAAGNDTRKGLGLVAAYSLSKRTTLYTGVTAQRTTLGNGADNNAADVTAYAVGVNHAF